LPGVADCDRLPDALDLVGILDSTSLDEIPLDVDPLEIDGERGGERARVDRHRHPGQRLPQRAGGIGDGVQRADPEAWIGHDLAARLPGALLLVLAHDERRVCVFGQHRDRRQREGARPRLDVGHVARQPGHGGRRGHRDAPGAGGVGHGERSLPAVRHQKVTVRPPSTVRT